MVWILTRAVEILIREVAAVLHAEALHQFVGGNLAALTYTVDGPTVPAPTPSVVHVAVLYGAGEQLSGMNIEDLLVMGGIVAVAVGTTIGCTIACLVLRCWLN